MRNTACFHVCLAQRLPDIAFSRERKNGEECCEESAEESACCSPRLPFQQQILRPAIRILYAEEALLFTAGGDARGRRRAEGAIRPSLRGRRSGVEGYGKSIERRRRRARRSRCAGRRTVPNETMIPTQRRSAPLLYTRLQDAAIGQRTAKPSSPHAEHTAEWRDERRLQPRL